MSRAVGTLAVIALGLWLPLVAGALLEYLSLGWLMAVRAALAVVAEVYALVITRRNRL